MELGVTQGPRCLEGEAWPQLLRNKEAEWEGPGGGGGLESRRETEVGRRLQLP